jgi:hypothetical protein
MVGDGPDSTNVRFGSKADSLHSTLLCLLYPRKRTSQRLDAGRILRAVLIAEAGWDAASMPFQSRQCAVRRGLGLGRPGTGLVAAFGAAFPI